MVMLTNKSCRNEVLQQRPALPAATSQLHVAIICDGNGRWATSRSCHARRAIVPAPMPRGSVIHCAPHLGLHTLTLFALSSANWKRPPGEVAAILQILQEYLTAETVALRRRRNSPEYHRTARSSARPFARGDRRFRGDDSKRDESCIASGH